MENTGGHQDQYGKYLRILQPFFWVFAALFLIALLSFYLQQSQDETMARDLPFAVHPEPQENVRIGGKLYRVPGNYVRAVKEAEENQGSEIAIHALLPDLDPYSARNWEEFEDYGANSSLLVIYLSGPGLTVGSEERMSRVYKGFLSSGAPWLSSFNLEHYTFRAGTLYADQDLFVGRDDSDRLALFLCFREGPLVPSPGCSRTVLLDDKVMLTYRFRRNHMARWRELDSKVRHFVSSLEAEQPQP